MLALLAILAPLNPSPTRRFVFAAIYYLMGVFLAFAIIKTRGRIGWKNGPEASLASQMAMLFCAFVWGTTSLGSGLGWEFFLTYDMLLYGGSMALVLLLYGVDKWHDSD